MDRLTKSFINRALQAGLVLALMCCGPLANGAEKRQRPKATPATKVQVPVTPVRAETNPEFLKRLADPEFNPDPAARQRNPAQLQQAAQTLADQFCQNFNVSYMLGNNAQGCYLDIIVTHNYTYSAGSTNPAYLPHGLHLKMCPGIKITSYQTTGAWFSGATFGSSPSNAPWDELWWTKAPASNFANTIPSGQTLKVRLQIPGLCASTPCPVIVEELTGWAHPNLLNFWSCRVVQTVLVTQQGYFIGSDSQLCAGSATTITLNPAPPSGAQVTWYKYVGSPCPPASCATLPLGPPWVPDTGGTGSYNTNNLDHTTCYVAVIKDGCITSVSNVRTIDVCPAPPSASISPTPAANFPAPVVIDNVAHACTQWRGQLCLNPQTFPCATKIVNWTVNGVPVANSAGKTCIDTQVLTTTTCSKTYDFTANLSNACGTAAPTWRIVIDGPPVAGTITANPPPPLCYDKATKLTHTTSCGKVVQWEKREEVSPCSGTPGNYGPWTPIPGSAGTSVWWTNDLQKTTEYRVIVDNGACGPVKPPATFRVTIRPKLTASISANKTILCPPGPVTLTTQHSWGAPCNYAVTYQWFRNGVLIPGANQATFNPSTGGNYHVIVTGNPCGKVKSNVITVCNPPKLVITGDCCVCKDKPITLTAATVWSPKNCPVNCTYNWTGSGIIGPTTNATVQVGAPGAYTVTVNCGGCQLTATYNVGTCQ